jgi:hypothetical protein
MSPNISTIKKTALAHPNPGEFDAVPPGFIVPKPIAFLRMI